MDGSTPSTNAPNGNTSPNSAGKRVGMSGMSVLLESARPVPGTYQFRPKRRTGTPHGRTSKDVSATFKTSLLVTTPGETLRMANERLRDAMLRNGLDLEHVANATDVDPKTV